MIELSPDWSICPIGQFIQFKETVQTEVFSKYLRSSIKLQGDFLRKADY